MIEIHLDGKPVTKLEAARALAVVNGPTVQIGRPNEEGWIEEDVTVYPCGSAGTVIHPPHLSCMSFRSFDAAEMRQQAQMITIAAEIADLAEMIAAEQDAPESAPRCTWCHEPAVDGEYCAPCTAAKAKVNAPGQGAPLRVLTAAEAEVAERITYLACGDQLDGNWEIGGELAGSLPTGAPVKCPRHGSTEIVSVSDYVDWAATR